MEGRYHNAKACTFDGRDLWIAYLVDGRILLATVQERTTESEAIEYLAQELQVRRIAVPVIQRCKAPLDPDGIDYNRNRYRKGR